MTDENAHYSGGAVHSKIWNSPLPHEQESRPIGRILPSLRIRAAYADPHCSQAASTRSSLVRGLTQAINTEACIINPYIADPEIHSTIIIELECSLQTDKKRDSQLIEGGTEQLFQKNVKLWPGQIGSDHSCSQLGQTKSANASPSETYFATCSPRPSSQLGQRANIRQTSPTHLRWINLAPNYIGYLNKSGRSLQPATDHTASQSGNSTRSEGGDES